MAVRYCAQWCLLIRTFHSPKVDLHRFEASCANSVSLEFKVVSQGVVAKHVAMSDQGLLIKACIVSDNPPEKKLGTLRSGWQSATRGVVTLHMNGQTQRTSMQGASKLGVPLITSSECANH